MEWFLYFVELQAHYKAVSDDTAILLLEQQSMHWGLNKDSDPTSYADFLECFCMKLLFPWPAKSSRWF